MDSSEAKIEEQRAEGLKVGWKASSLGRRGDPLWEERNNEGGGKRDPIRNDSIKSLMNLIIVYRMIRDLLANFLV